MSGDPKSEGDDDEDVDATDSNTFISVFVNIRQTHKHSRKSEIFMQSSEGSL